MEPQVAALQSSVARLRALVEALDDSQLEQQAYPSQWRIAEVLSHLGSGAVISVRRLDDGLAGTTMPDDFAPTVWAEWNVKTPRDKADDALTADRVFLDRLLLLSDAEKAGFSAALGPLTVD